MSEEIAAVEVEVAAPSVEVAATAEVPVVAPVEVEVTTTDFTSLVSEHAEGKPALAVALNFLGTAGIDPAGEAFELARDKGDFSLLKAQLATKGLAGTDQMLAILEGEVKANGEAHAAYLAETESHIDSILGDQRGAILEWGKANATDVEKEVINTLLDAGGLYARAASMMLRDAYLGGGNTKAAANPVKAGTPPADGNTPITAREFAEATQKMHKELGGDFKRSPQYAALAARRNDSRARGI